LLIFGEELSVLWHCRLTGWGKYVPERVVTNEELARTLDTSDEWIRSRTGIRERRIAAAEESTATLAVRAGQAALEQAGVAAEELDLIIVSTVTPDYPLPATACLVQEALGASRAAAFDLAAGCTGFVYALAVASQMIHAGACRTILVIGAETLSRITDWKDRNTCVLLGDGAGAFVLQASEQPGGILSCWLGADGSGSQLLVVPAGGSRQPATTQTVQERQHYLKMNGRAVFRFATQVLARSLQEVVLRAGLTWEDVDLIIPHQANQHIIESAARDLDLPLDKFFLNLEYYGNTSAASVPIAACDAVAAGRLKLGFRVAFVAFGAGLTWGAVLAEWGPAPVAPELRHQLPSQRPVALANPVS
jgi:3-oxoacyl-[acyl-carrier-protein] synthase-3